MKHPKTGEKLVGNAGTPNPKRQFSVRAVLAADGGHRYIRAYFELAGYKFPAPGKKQYNSLKWEGEASSRISIYRRGDRWHFKDFGTGDGGDCFALAAIAAGLDLKNDFGKVLEEVSRFYGLSEAAAFPAAPPRSKKQEKDHVPFRVNLGRKPKVSYRYQVAGPASAESYPKPISTATLARYGVKHLRWIEHTESGRRTRATAENPIFLFSAGANEKIYRPSADKRFKQVFAASAGNYCFGYEQLPESCEHIIITAGQNDTMAVNQMLNPHGIYAVCLLAEGIFSLLDTPFLEELKTRCNGVFVAYDDDETGNRSAEKISEKYGIPALRIPHQAGVNDVCDAVEKAGEEWTRAAFLDAIEAAGAIGATEAGTVYDFAAEIHQAIDKHQRLIIQAPTGSGKTYGFLLKQFGIAAQLAARYDKRVIFSLPYNVLTEQAAAEYGIPYVNGASDAEEKRKARFSDVCACTYDSLRHVAIDPQSEIIIVDELQEMAYADYRDRKKEYQVCKRLFYYGLQAFRMIGLSATPPRFMEHAGFTYLELKAGKQPPVYLHPIICEGDEDAAAMDLLKKWDYSRGKVVVRLQDKTAGAAMAEQLAAHLPPGMRSAAINANNKDTSPDARHIIEQRELPADLAACFFTSIADVGINLNNEDIAAAVIVDKSNDTPDPDAWQQFIARARRAKELHVFILLRGREGREYDAEKVLQGYLEDAKEDLKILVSKERRSGTPAGKRQYERFTDSLRLNEHVTRNAFNQSWEIDILNILRNVRFEANSSRSAHDLIYHLLDRNPHYTMTGFNNLSAHADEALIEHKSLLKQEEKEADATVNRLLAESPAIALEAIFHATKDSNPAARQEIRSAGYCGELSRPSPGAEELIAEYDQAFSTASLGGVFRFLRLEALGMTSGEIANVFRALGDEYTDRKLMRLHRKYGRCMDAAGALAARSREKEALNTRDADRLLELSENAPKTRARLTAAIAKRIEKMKKWDSYGSAEMEKAERTKDKIERTKRLREIGPYFDRRTFSRWAAAIEAQRLVYLGATEKRRKNLSAGELQEVEAIRQYADTIARHYMAQGRVLTHEKNLEIYRKACGKYQRQGAAELALQSLFEVEEEGEKWVVSCRTFLKKTATKYGFSIASILPEKLPLEAIEADLKKNVENRSSAKNILNPKPQNEKTLIEEVELLDYPELDDVPF